ncbi:MAG: molybdopterin converting factor subunit 1 [Alphaproteobacteria bacterium]|nr:molybdopterin converting factor subunit 1 [Alphaproteobacteria bacterium]
MIPAPDTQSHDAGTSPAATLTLRYFAWVREKVGHAEERVTLPADVATVADLMTWLGQRGETYASAFARPDVIRTAIDHNHVRPDAAIAGAREIAFFPPVTGG